MLQLKQSWTLIKSMPQQEGDTTQGVQQKAFNIGGGHQQNGGQPLRHSDSSDKGNQVGRVASNRVWPGVKEYGRDDKGCNVEEERTRSKGNQWMTVRLRGEKARLFAGTGSRYTHISPEMYNEKMGKLVQAKRVKVQI